MAAMTPHLSDAERDAIVALAIGRIFRLGSRPTQPGDVEQYEGCRRIIIDLLDPAGEARPDYVPCWARDRLRGAQGD